MPHHPSREPIPSISPAEACDYVEQMAKGLSALVPGRRLRALRFLLDMVQMEAQRQALAARPEPARSDRA